MHLAVAALPWGRTANWVGFFAIVLVSWAMLFAMSADFALRAPVALLGPGMTWLTPLFPEAVSSEALIRVIEAICFAGPSSGEALFSALLGMWSLMTVAMMAPTAVPLLQAYGDLAAGNPERIGLAGFWGLLAGFSLVWIGFAVIATLTHAVSASWGAITVGGLLRSDWLAAALLALAGIYQFSALKAACLSRCRSPMAFFLANWCNGLGGSLRMGLLQGLACLGCCWALMGLAFVGGTMNLVWMGAAMVLMTTEKLPVFGRYITAPVGVVLITCALVVAWRATSF